MGQAVKMEIIFELDENPQGERKVHVNGPLADKMLCYEMLREAANLVSSYKGQQQMIAVPRLVTPNNLPN